MRLVKFVSIGMLAAGLALTACSDDDNEKKDGGSTDAKIGEGVLDTLPAVDQPIPDADTDKTPKITAIIPSDGFADGGTLGYIPVVMIGENFAAGARVYIDGSNTIMQVNVSSQASVNFHMPKNPYGNATSGYKPYRADISIMSNGLISDTVKFTYTAAKDMDAKNKGVVTSATNTSYAGFWSHDIEGKVYFEGITDATTFDKNKITAYVGYGPVGKDPAKDSGWRWVEATYSKIDTGYAVYTAKVKVPNETTYDIAYRFSTDLGMNYIYADADETDLAYDSAKAAKLTASKAPALYCQENTDCLTAASYMFTCKVDSSDDTKNTCVGCLADKDCVSPMPENLGPKCDTTSETCYCAADGDCAKNPLGKKCVSKRCGCAADTDCPSGLKCDGNSYICM